MIGGKSPIAFAVVSLSGKMYPFFLKVRPTKTPANKPITPAMMFKFNYFMIKEISENFLSNL